MKNFIPAVLSICFVVLGFNAQAKNASYSINTTNIVTDTTALVEYKGKYLFPDGAPVPDVMVFIEKESLKATSAQGEFALKAVEGKADNFTIDEINAEVVFTRDENKKITGLTVKLLDGTLVGKKEEAK